MSRQVCSTLSGKWAQNTIGLLHLHRAVLCCHAAASTFISFACMQGVDMLGIDDQRTVCVMQASI